tara:strand:+ start:72135 stop:72695 length:561 start_codon:yes stop_codon:yes gene_type:complete
MKRIFDISLAVILALLFLPLAIIAAVVIVMVDGRPFLHWSKRVGQNESLFEMPKFRTMKKDTPQLATHLLGNGKSYLIVGGSFLRKSSLDELPQLWSILAGDMSFVGPRPALFNQADLMEMRRQHGIEKLKPGLTGWAQVNGRDEISLEEKVHLELFYLNNQSFILDLRILWLTFFKVLSKNDIAH